MITDELDPQKHNRNSFDCGEESITTFLQTQASQWVRRGLATCWVWNSEHDNAIVGFYTLSAATVGQSSATSTGAGSLPHNIPIPAILIGRLAVNKQYQNKHKGTMLLLDAFHRAITSEVAWVVVVVDAIDEDRARWYEKFGFVRIEQSPIRLGISRKTIENLLATSNAE